MFSLPGPRSDQSLSSQRRRGFVDHRNGKPGQILAGLLSPQGSRDMGGQILRLFLSTTGKRIRGGLPVPEGTQEIVVGKI